MSNCLKEFFELEPLIFFAKLIWATKKLFLISFANIRIVHYFVGQQGSFISIKSVQALHISIVGSLVMSKLRRMVLVSAKFNHLLTIQLLKVQLIPFKSFLVFECIVLIVFESSRLFLLVFYLEWLLNWRKYWTQLTSLTIVKLGYGCFLISHWTSSSWKKWIFIPLFVGWWPASLSFRHSLGCQILILLSSNLHS